MIFHIDGNSFYASCERLFRPDLCNKPIAVLTNNDGIIIALSKECKALGYKRGDVFFKLRDKLAKDGVAVFSSNYTLYADISARMNLIYCRFTPENEIYSIDESFLFFPKWRNVDYSEIGFKIKETVKKEIGMPVSIGIAPTKTLAKFCNKLAKNRNGVCDYNKIDADFELSKYPVEDIWGIGYSKSAFLKKHGIYKALDLKRYPLDKAKKNLTVVGFRTVQELNGIPANVKAEQGTRQNIICSKSFSSAVLELDPIIKTLADYTREAVSRMREDNLSCRYISVFLMTNPYSEGGQYYNQASAELNEPSSYFPDILHISIELLKSIYKEGYKYRKVLINLMGLVESSKKQLDLFEDFEGNAKKERNEKIMKSFDTITNKYGRNSISVASNLLVKNLSDKAECWEMKREYLSPEYTTKISDIPKVR